MLRVLVIIGAVFGMSAAGSASAQEDYEIRTYMAKINTWNEAVGTIMSDISRILLTAKSMEEKFDLFIDDKIGIDDLRMTIAATRNQVTSEAQYARESIDYLPPTPRQPDWAENGVYYTPDRLEMLISHFETMAVEALDFYEAVIENETVDVDAYEKRRIERISSVFLFERMGHEASVAQFNSKVSKEQPNYFVERYRLNANGAVEAILTMLSSLLGDGDPEAYTEALTEFNQLRRDNTLLVTDGQKVQSDKLKEMRALCPQLFVLEQQDCERLVQVYENYDHNWTIQNDLEACFAKHQPQPWPVTESTERKLWGIFEAISIMENHQGQLASDRREMLTNSIPSYNYTFFDAATADEMCVSLDQLAEDMVGEDEKLILGNEALELPL